MSATAQAEGRLEAAYKLFKEKRFDESEELFESLTGDPDLGPQAKSGLGLIYLERGDAARARRTFSEVLGEGHPTAEAYYGLGVIAEPTDKGYARAQYEFALRVNPHHLGASRRLARLDAIKPTNVEKGASGTDALPDPTKSDNPRQGVARRVRFRTELRGRAFFNICEFLLEREKGMDPITVHMAGSETKGIINDGDVIIIPKLPHAGQILRTNSVHNISVNSDVIINGQTSAPISKKENAIMIWLISLSIGLGIILSVFS